MTKKKMIETIQGHEAKLFLMLKEDEREYGRESKVTNIARHKWAAINELLKELKIEADYKHPDNQKALEIVTNRVREEVMVEQFEQEDFDKRDQGL
jgi:hypothetical protein